MSEEPPAGTASHAPAIPAALREYLQTGWASPGAAPGADTLAAEEVAPYAAKRRGGLSARFPGEALVIPGGTPKVRANDTDYPFRAGSDFAWLTGHLEPDAVLVLRPDGPGHQATLYLPARSDRASLAFFSDRRYGELWVGPRRGVREAAAALLLETAPRAGLAAALSAHPDARVLRGYDSEVDAAVDAHPEQDGELATVLGELRLVKDDWEVAQLEEAVAATIRGFEDAVRELPRAIQTSERWLEGTFNRRARVEGNDVGYGSIVACGPHATTLHWVRNDGPVRPGDLALLDMGVEARTLYTADVTRTLPISGRFTPLQRQVYEAVWRAQQAGFAACRPGAAFVDPHRAAMAVLAAALEEWGILPVPAEQSLAEDPAAPGAGLHRRYTLHGTSHMLGLDVHDCAAARDQAYRDGTLAAGMVLTVEPGLYFQPDDLTVPEDFRGIGVRIEDDVLVTPDGARVLSAALPSRAEDLEAWMAGLA
ncbi:MAG: aminopeptidase P family protein [Mycobacteriales bacterium]